MQSVGIPCGMGIYQTELALRLMKYDDLDITASYFLPVGEDRNVECFDFPVKRVKFPTPFLYHTALGKSRRLLHAIERPLFRMLRPFVTYESLVGDTGKNIYIFFDNRVPLVRVSGRIIAVIYDIIPMKCGSPDSGEAVKKNTEEVVRKASKIITISEHSKKDIEESFHVSPEQIEVLYCGINPSDFAEDRDISRYNLPEKYILYFGSCNAHKNVPALVKAYSILPAEFMDTYKLVITNPSNEIKDLVNAQGISEHVHYLDEVPDEDKPGIFRGASLFVWPSLYEGFGLLPILEAQASGVPVVCSNAASMPEVAGDSAILFDPHDTEAIASAIERVLTNEDLRDELAVKGCENIKRFSWDKSAQKLHDIIINL